MKAALVTEEAIGSLISHGNRDGKVRVTVRIFLGTVTIDMAAPGSEYNLTEAMSSATLPLEEEELDMKLRRSSATFCCAPWRRI